MASRIESGVTFDRLAATLYADGSYEHAGVSVSDGDNSFTAQAQDAHGHNVSQTVTAWIAANTAALKYDLNGNLTNDSYRTFFYDDDNQLTNVTIAGVTKSEFVYDGLRRRRIQKQYGWNGTWAQTNEVHYVYYGNLVMQERDGNNVPLVTYTRGKDLSGGLQRAGGVGGLLARTDANGSLFYHADGNGDIACLIDTNGMVVARYEYDPFGNMLAMDGPMADVNIYRFSSKEWNAGSGLYYFGRRLYDPVLQRWINRDPIQELGGINLYGFVGNSPSQYIDPFGLQDSELSSDGKPAEEDLFGGEIGKDGLDYSDLDQEREAQAAAEAAQKQQEAQQAAAQQADEDAAKAAQDAAEKARTPDSEGSTPKGGLPEKVTSPKTCPKPSPNFRPPTNLPQLPPTVIPPGWRVREMPPTQQYPDGYWKLEKPMKDGSWQPINPSTMQPGTKPETHVPFPQKAGN